MVNPVMIAFVAAAVAAILLFVVVRVSGARRLASAGRGGKAISILPGSSLGRWSVGLAIAFLLALVAVQVLPGDDLLDAESNQALAVVLRVLFIGMSGASFSAGLISVIRRKEASVLVIAGMMVTLWLGLITMVGHFFME